MPAKWTAALAIFVALTSGTAFSSELIGPSGIDGSGCNSNCVSITRYFDHLLVLARNARGEVFKTLSLDLPRNARPLTSNRRTGKHSQTGAAQAGWPDTMNTASVPVGTTCYAVSGVCTETAVMRYVTPSQYIFYTFTYVFSDGQLVEVRVDETRVSRNKID